ncbi:MAG: DUF4191 domain-containing protein [Actinomycetota bacterium]|nr:DUF4191 domain-containing protein [Actinomycetota bacterium]
MARLSKPDLGKLKLGRKPGGSAPKATAAARGGAAKKDKEAKPKAERGARFKQLWVAFKMTRENDPRLVPYLLAALIGPIIVFVVVGILIGHWLYLTFVGILIAFTLAMAVFGRRASKAMFAQVEGQPGAALAILQSMRGDWRVTPVVALTTNQDMVHRVLGRPGVILVAEGSPRRLRPLLGQEKKKVGRLIGDTPVYDVIVGDEEGQVGLRKLQNHFVKLPRNITPKQVNALDTRLSALGGMKVPMPKGPVPKGARVARGPKAPR